jgi:hypothetical protein
MGVANFGVQNFNNTPARNVAVTNLRSPNTNIILRAVDLWSSEYNILPATHQRHIWDINMQYITASSKTESNKIQREAERQITLLLSLWKREYCERY